MLPKYVRDEGERLKWKNLDLEEAHSIIVRWADLESDSHLNRKETAMDADFLNEVFGDALGYKTATRSPKHYNLEREFSIPGIGASDGALGHFGPDAPGSGTAEAVIELAVSV